MVSECAHDIYTHISGIDLIRDLIGTFMYWRITSVLLGRILYAGEPGSNQPHFPRPVRGQ